MVVWLCSCAPTSPHSASETNVSAPTPGASQPDPKANPPSASHLDFTLINLTGIPLEAVYVSPSQSAGWEDNIIAGTTLGDGESVRIRFNQNEQATSWDLRVVGLHGPYTDWKGLDLSKITTAKLRLKPGVAPFAVIEAE